MKITFLVSGLILISSGCNKVEGDKNQRSYSVGYALGQQLTPVKDDIDPEMVARGLKEMPAGAEWTVHLAPEQAYGVGTRPGIPSQSALVYGITLVRTGKSK